MTQQNRQSRRPYLRSTGAIRLGGIGAPLTALEATIILVFFLAIPLIVLLSQGLGDHIRFGSVIANVVVFTIASLFVRISVDKHSKQTLQRTQNEYQLEISLLLAILTTSAAILEVTHGFSRPVDNYVIFESVFIDILFGSVAFLFGFVVLNLGLEELKQLQGGFSKILANTFFTTTVALYASYTAYISGFFGALDPLGSVDAYRTVTFVIKWLALVIAAAYSTIYGIKYARLFAHQRSKRQWALRNGGFALVFLALSCLFWSSSASLSPKRTSPTDGDQAMIATQQIVIPPTLVFEETSDNQDNGPKLSFTEPVFLSPNSIENHLGWRNDSFRDGSLDTFNSGKKIADLNIPLSTLRIICEREVLIVGAGASTSGTPDQNKYFSEVRTEALAELFHTNIKNQNRTACRNSNVRIFALNLGPFDSSKADHADQRRPLVIATNVFPVGSQLNAKNVAEMVSSEVISASDTDLLPDLCYADYGNPSIYEYKSNDLNLSPMEFTFPRTRFCE